ncbi:MAG: MgtC/SapB family protein [Cyclobacteriaceae bacterium]
MDMNVDLELGLRLLISFVIGTAIGLEREYRSKAAGLRTMIMICLGSTIFTELSISMGGANADRIASTIVTGVGFLGAGVIFKDGMTITGITTATTIWISAALGMAVGAGEYFIAIVSSFVVLIVLIAFEKLQWLVERSHQSRTYKIITDHSNFLDHLEKDLKKLDLGFKKKRDLKENNHFVLHYEVFGKEKKLDHFNTLLKEDERVSSYDY